MNWIERILGSDAGRGSREVAERMVREGGGEVPEIPRLPTPSPETVLPSLPTPETVLPDNSHD